MQDFDPLQMLTTVVCKLYVKQEIHFIQCFQPGNHRQIPAHYRILYMLYLKEEEDDDQSQMICWS